MKSKPIRLKLKGKRLEKSLSNKSGSDESIVKYAADIPDNQYVMNKKNISSENELQTLFMKIYKEIKNSGKF